MVKSNKQNFLRFGDLSHKYRRNNSYFCFLMKNGNETVNYRQKVEEKRIK